LVRVYLIALGLVLMLAGSTRADHITLKYKLFSGWKYSVDGGPWHGCGSRGDKLREAMAGHEEAQEVMQRYEDRREAYGMTGLLAAGLTFFYFAQGSGDDGKSNAWLIAPVFPLFMFAMMNFFLSVNDIQRAVRIYNGEEQALKLDMRYDRCRLDDDGTFKVILTFGL